MKKKLKKMKNKREFFIGNSNETFPWTRKQANKFKNCANNWRKKKH